MNTRHSASLFSMASSNSNQLSQFYEVNQETLTPECRALLSSLPTCEGWGPFRLHNYQGQWLASPFLQAVLAFQNHFQACDSDLILVTPPKSGTTWLKALAYAIVHRNTHSFSDHPLMHTHSQELVPSLEIHLYYKGRIPEVASFPSPRMFSTHMSHGLLLGVIEKELTRCKFVFLCRIPSDTLISWWKFVNTYRLEVGAAPILLEDAFERFCRGQLPFGPYWSMVLEYWKASQEDPDKVLFIRYEQLKENPTFHVKRLAQFLGFPFTEEEEKQGVIEEVIKLCSFENLSSLEVNKTGHLSTGVPNKLFYRGGKVGDHANYLTPQMLERLDQITEEHFQGSGLEIINFMHK